MFKIEIKRSRLVRSEVAAVVSSKKVEVRFFFDIFPLLACRTFDDKFIHIFRKLKIQPKPNQNQNQNQKSVFHDEKKNIFPGPNDY